VGAARPSGRMPTLPEYTEFGLLLGMHRRESLLVALAKANLIPDAKCEHNSEQLEESPHTSLTGEPSVDGDATLGAFNALCNP
jgi:hypothetical protein